MQTQNARWILQALCWMLLYAGRAGVAYAEADNAWLIPLNASRDSISAASKSENVMKNSTATIDAIGPALKLSGAPAGANEGRDLLGLQHVDMTSPEQRIAKRSSADLLSESMSGHILQLERPLAHAHLPKRSAVTGSLARKAILLDASPNKEAPLSSRSLEAILLDASPNNQTPLPSRPLEVSQIPGSQD